MADPKSKMTEFLLEAAKQNASDLHINVGRYPTLRIDDNLLPLVKEQLITPDASAELLPSVLSDDQKATLEKYRDVDFSISIDNKARFRCNVFYQRGNHLAGAFRYIPSQIRTIEELNLPSILKGFSNYEQGFILVVGPAGVGKSTTLAALIDSINHTFAKHIITIEDPVEYIFNQDKSIINQREIGRFGGTWHRALRSALRQDPDVLMVGEMRDPASIAIAITAAETGHLVFSTLHTNSASQTIDRIIDSFPASQQNQIKIQLASTLVGIVSQRLIPKKQGGRVPATEIMFATPAIRNLIREGKVYQIDLVIETSTQEGMLSLNRSLVALVKAGHITKEDADNYSLNPTELKYLLES